MGTPSNRSAGTQITKAGVTQGEVLVDPVSGQPINVIKDGAGIRRLAVDANLTADNITVDTDDLKPTVDQVGIGDAVTGDFMKVHPDGSIDTNVKTDSLSDSIAVGDSVTGDKLKVNADGSINVNTGATFASGTPTIFNVPVPAANTEVSQALPAGTTKFMIRVRDDASKMQLAFTAGQSSTQFITIGRGVVYTEDGIFLTATTLYFQLNKSGQTVEILTWN